MVLTLALNYSARTELVDAFRSIVDAAARNGGLEHLEIDEDAVSQNLYTRHLPDPDLVIRTSGEMRLSNFLLWQLAYAEIYVTPTLWPSFADCIFWKASLNIRNASGAMADWPGTRQMDTVLLTQRINLATILQDGPELTRLATTETNSHRGGPDSDCSGAGAAGAGAGTCAGHGAGCAAGDTGITQDYPKLTRSGLFSGRRIFSSACSFCFWR